jgi:hypothetical protein
MLDLNQRLLRPRQVCYRTTSILDEECLTGYEPATFLFWRTAGPLGFKLASVSLGFERENAALYPNLQKHLNFGKDIGANHCTGAGVDFG